MRSWLEAEMQARQPAQSRFVSGILNGHVLPQDGTPLLGSGLADLLGHPCCPSDGSDHSIVKQRGYTV